MSHHHQQQWYNVIIKHAVNWENGPENRAVLLVPRFRRGPLAKWLQPRLRRPCIRVKLDEFGSFVWQKIDGQVSFLDIVVAMRDHFGQRVEPAEDRLKKFLTLLYKDKFIELYSAVENKSHE